MANEVKSDSFWVKLSRVKIPHVYVLLFCLSILSAIGTWVLPAGEFTRVFNETLGRNMVIPGTFHPVESNPIGLFDMCMAIIRGFVRAADIIALVFFAYGSWFLVLKTGALHDAIGAMLRTFKPHQQKYIMPVSFLIFACSASVFGVFEECYGFLPFFVGMAIALGYDAIVGCAVVAVGLGMGYTAATINPFTVVLGQKIAELPLLSGLEFRLGVAAVMFSASIWWIMRYASRIKADPTKSYMYGIDMGILGMDHDTLAKTPFSTRSKLVCLVCVITIGFIVWGTTTKDWYVDEITGAFILMAIVCGLIAKMSADTIARTFVEGFSEIAFGAILIGLSRTMLVILEKGHIIDTVAYYISYPLASFPSIVGAQGMLVVQNLINFFIPSGTGQVAVTMPIMAPVADILGISRQVAVLAFQFGDGLSNLLWPTASIPVICAIAHVPLEKWYKFFVPFFGIAFFIQVCAIAVAVYTGV